MREGLRIDEEWADARLQIAKSLENLTYYGDIGTTLNAKEIHTVNANGNNEVNIEHGYHGLPSGYIVVGQTGAGNIFTSKVSDNKKMYFKSNVTGVQFRIMIF